MPEREEQVSDDDQVIPLESDDGQTHRCRLLGTFELAGQEYALLLNLDAAEAASPATVVMRLSQQGDRAIFQTIEDDAEFDRVMAFVKDIAREMDQAGEASEV